jgi:hypothetical protein
MRFMGLKIGKSTEKNENGNAGAKGSTATHATELEEHLNGRTDNLKQTAKQLKKLSDKVSSSKENEGISHKPHRPIAVLEVRTEDIVSGADIIRESEIDNPPEEEGEVVKLVEVSAKAATLPKAEAANPPKAQAATPPKAQAATPPKAEATTPPKEEKKPPPEEGSDSLNKLFSNDDEEENPLANLIRSLPDVTTEELIDDLNEIKAIIKDWQKK